MFGVFCYVGLGVFRNTLLFSCPYRIQDYFSDILFTFLTTFVLITKLESLSVSLFVGLSFYLSYILLTFLTTFVLITKLKSLSICLSVCLSVGLSFYLSDILLTFLTTFVLINKLKSRSVFYLSVCRLVCLYMFLSF